MNIDTDSHQTSQNQAETEDKPPKANQQKNTGPHDGSGIEYIIESSSVLNRPMLLGQSRDCHFVNVQQVILDTCPYRTNKGTNVMCVVTVTVALSLAEHFPGEKTTQFKLCKDCY